MEETWWLLFQGGKVVSECGGETYKGIVIIIS